MNTSEIAAIMWRMLKLLWKAAWSLLGFLGLVVTLDTGWPGFTSDIKQSGLIGWFMRFLHTLIGLFTSNLIGCLTLLVCVAILTHLLVEKARERSKIEFQSKRKKRAPNGKAKRK